MRDVRGAALLALLLCGCGPAAPPAASPSAASAPGYPREVDAPDGAKLSLAAPPQRVVAGSAGLGDLVCELLDPARIAGLPDQMRDYSGHRAGGDPFLARPAFHVFAAEPVLALQPDFVVADHWQPADTVARLREAGLPVLVVERLERLADVRAALRLVARVVGEESRGEQVLAALDARVEALAAKPGARRGLRALAYTNGGTGGWVAGAGTSADEWIALAGLDNALASRDGHVRFAYEELIATDPDVLIVPGPDNPDERGGTEQIVRGEPALASLRARRRGLIVTLPSWLFSTNSQHIVTAAEELAHRLDAQLAVAPP
jgi:iron complex transport system substrate-binding protein